MRARPRRRAQRRQARGLPAGRAARSSCPQKLQSARRAPAGAPGRSRTGTCRGSSGSGGPSAERSRPRGTRARGLRCASSASVTPRAAGEDLTRERDEPRGLGRVLRERNHRAVREVQLDPLAALAGRPAPEREAGGRSDGDDAPSRGPTHRRSAPLPSCFGWSALTSLASLAARPQRAAGRSSGRRRRARPSDRGP